MGKLMVGRMRFLFFCAMLLALPAIAAAQPAAPSDLRIDTYGESYGLWLAWRVNSNNESGFKYSMASKLARSAHGRTSIGGEG